MRFRTRAALTATAVGCAAAAVLAATVLPTSAAAGPRTDASAATSPHDTLPTATSDSPSASGSASASDSASATPSPSAAYPSGPPIVQLSGPRSAVTGDEIELDGRVLGPDGQPAPLQTPVVIRALAYNRSPSTATIVDRPIIGLDGRFTSILGITRSAYFTAEAVNTGSGNGERATSKPVLVVVKALIGDVSVKIVGGKLVVKGSLIPGQQVRIGGHYGAAAVLLVTRTGKRLRVLATTFITSRPGNGRNRFAFKPITLPPPGSYIAIGVLATQMAPAVTKPRKVPVLYVPRAPAPRRPAPAPSPSSAPSSGVPTVF